MTQVRFFLKKYRLFILTGILLLTVMIEKMRVAKIVSKVCLLSFRSYFQSSFVSRRSSIHLQKMLMVLSDGRCCRCRRCRRLLLLLWRQLLGRSLSLLLKLPDHLAGQVTPARAAVTAVAAFGALTVRLRRPVTLSAVNPETKRLKNVFDISGLNKR